MIALLAPGEAVARTLAAPLRANETGVDGIFITYHGLLKSAPITIYALPPDGGTAAAYAAGKVAHRRGAHTLLTVALTCIGPRTQERYEVELGGVLPITQVNDLSKLAPLLRLLPESAREFPLDPLQLLQGTSPLALAPDGDGATLGSLPWETTNAHLLDALSKSGHADLIDLQSHGAARSAKEDGLDCRIIGIIGAILGARSAQRITKLELHSVCESIAAQIAG